MYVAAMNLYALADVLLQGLSFLAGLAMKKSEGSRNSAEVDEKGSNSSGSRRASLDRPRKPPHLSLAVS